MADIAMIFHWPPAAFETMPLDELMTWHRLAVERYEAQLKAQNQ
jgi:hypothetical protein